MLKFNFMQGDSVLESRVENGFYSIFQAGINGVFKVSGYLNNNIIDLGTYPDIYKALEAANRHYKNDPKQEITDEEWDLQCDVMQYLAFNDSVGAIKCYKERTGCSLREAKEFVESLPFGSEPKSNTPCPSCGKLLRTDLAKQCFECGKDWH